MFVKALRLKKLGWAIVPRLIIEDDDDYFEF